MSDQTPSETMPESDDPLRCPWCSAKLASVDEAICPSCHATLKEAAESELPGVTRVDHEAILRARKPPAKSGGLMGWLSGSYQEAPEAPPAPGTFSPPDDDVKREMIRLELAAIEAQIEAQRAELDAELMASGGHLPEPVGPSDADPQADADVQNGAEVPTDMSADEASVPPA